MPPIRALLAISIVFAHFSYFGVVELSFLRVLAPVCVSIFLFISGYGLMVSYQKKGDAYLESFLQKRILKIALPAILVSLMHMLLCGNEGINLLERARLIVTKGATLLPHYWFVWAILYDYLVFWCSYRWLSGMRPRYAIVLLSIVFTIVTALAGFDRCWWVCSLAFPTGVFFASYESVLFSFCCRSTINYAMILVVCALAFITSLLSGSLALRTICYVALPVAVALLFAKLPLDRFRLPVLRLLGAISYELYLIHITVMTLLRNDPIQISSTPLYIIAVLCLSFALAYGVHLLCSRITKQTN